MSKSRPLATSHVTRLDLIQQLVTPRFSHHDNQDEPSLKGLAPPTDLQLFREAQRKAKLVTIASLDYNKHVTMTEERGSIKVCCTW